MGSVTKMLIGTDFSQHSSLAIEIGIEWAGHLHFTPYIVHINSIKKHNHEFESSIREELKTQIEQAGGDHTHVNNSYFLFGDKVDVLVEEVAKKNVKMLLLGTHGQDNLESTGTTGAAIRNVNCPILAVKGREVKHPRKIFWAMDFSELGQLTFEWVKILAETFNPTLILSHIETDSTPINYHENVERFAKVLNRDGIDYQTVFKKAAPGKIGPTLAQIIQEQDPDLVVLGTKAKRRMKRLFLGSVAEYLTTNVNKSFLIIKNS